MQNFDSRGRFLCEINEYMYEYMFNTPLENHKNILTERDFHFVQKPIVDTGYMYKHCKIKIETQLPEP